MRVLLTWPLPALYAWLAAWVLYLLLAGAVPSEAAWCAACALGAGAGWALGHTRWRRLFIAAGFPLSHALLGLGGTVSPWLWLLPLALLVLLYPMRSWRDAPLFPTPPGALQALPLHAPLAPGAAIVDAGCGLGDGLLELRRAYPEARLTGWEWSRPLRVLCALRCRDAQVRRADIWRADWSGYELVYLFQRPESMPRAAAKAQTELRAGAYLVSLEFEVPHWHPTAVLDAGPMRRVWVYRAPFASSSDSA